MSSSRIVHAKKNIIAGIVNKTITNILPFVIRTIIIYSLGEVYLGLNSLFTSIIQILNLADMGINEAIVFCLYRPINSCDHEQINKILSFYRKVYVIIGGIILILGFCIIPFLTLLIAKDVPNEVNIYLIYLIFLLNSVFSYWFGAYKGVIIIANQRNDILSNIQTVISILMNISQIVVLVLTKQYYLYIILLPVFTVANNLLISIIANKKYTFLNPSGDINKVEKNEIREMLSSLIVARFADSFRNTLDSIVLSSICGLIITARYGNYYVIFSVLYGFYLVVARSLQSGVGDSIVAESVSKNHEVFRTTLLLFHILLSTISVCMFQLYQPFIALWVGQNSMLPSSSMFLFCLYFYLLSMAGVGNLYLNGTGLWKEAKKYFILEAIMNLVLNILLGYLLGVTGILIATIVTIMAFNLFGRVVVVYKNYFNYFNFKVYVIYIIRFLIAMITSFVVIRYLCWTKTGDSLFSVLLKTVLACVVTNTLTGVSFFKDIQALIFRKKQNGSSR